VFDVLSINTLNPGVGPDKTKIKDKRDFLPDFSVSQTKCSVDFGTEDESSHVFLGAMALWGGSLPRHPESY
jgi:hypothetical protein